MRAYAFTGRVLTVIDIREGGIVTTANKRSVLRQYGLLLAAGVFTAGLAACGGKGDTGPAGATGPAGPPGPAGGTVPTALTMTITSAAVNNGVPVVDFKATDQNGAPFAGFVDSDLRFDIAKLTPGVLGSASTWQNYIVRGGSAMQGSQERLRSGFPWGTLVNHQDGSYTYTFATDIKNNNPCPAPCSDADGNPLDISYQPGLTHRIGIQQGNSSLPKSNATYDFVPSGGAVTMERNIVKTATCNQCHNQLTAHGSRIETKLCVTCHNPGSWVKGNASATPPIPDRTVDFKVFIHKLHYGEDLPSVIAGTPYGIGNADFSDVVFPADVRSNGNTNPIACTKCHDPNDSATPQAVAFEMPKRAACGACHDDVDFVTGANHPGGPQGDDAACVTCHAKNFALPTGPGTVMESHTMWDREYATKCFKYNILSVTPEPAAPGTTITITFSVTNPNPSLRLGADQSSGDPSCSAKSTYDIKADPEFTAGSASRLGIDVAWDTRDFNNTNSGTNPAQPISINALTASAPIGDGTFSVTATVPATGTSGTGEVAIEGHPAGIAPATPSHAQSTIQVPVTSVFKYFAITDTKAVARRQVVDIAKCDNCHTRLSLHGNNRVNEPQLCVICHNPNDTDVNRRPMTAGLPDPTLTLDKKKEEAIDFKRLIHGIHAAAQTKYDGTPADGFREKGLVIYGFGGGPNDFSDVRFPGILSDCGTCHLSNTYTLQGSWELPTQNGILGSTIDTAPGATALTFADQLADPADDSNISPTAAVCSSCHDSQVAQAHMEDNGALFGEPLGSAVVTQSMLDGNVESCAVCHGPGKIADVAVIHPKP
jgi:OmcA/MtrC family decaheme c-type cytochrome